MFLLHFAIFVARTRLGSRTQPMTRGVCGVMVDLHANSCRFASTITRRCPFPWFIGTCLRVSTDSEALGPSTTEGNISHPCHKQTGGSSTMGHLLGEAWSDIWSHEHGRSAPKLQIQRVINCADKQLESARKAGHVLEFAVAREPLSRFASGYFYTVQEGAKQCDTFVKLRIQTERKASIYILHI